MIMMTAMKITICIVLTILNINYYNIKRDLTFTRGCLAIKCHNLSKIQHNSNYLKANIYTRNQFIIDKRFWQLPVTVQLHFHLVDIFSGFKLTVTKLTKLPKILITNNFSDWKQYQYTDIVIWLIIITQFWQNIILSALSRSYYNWTHVWWGDACHSFGI